MTELVPSRRTMPLLQVAVICGVLSAFAGIADAADAPSNERFWYRLGTSDRYIDSQRGNLAFSYDDGKIYLSEDNGRTWPHGVPFPEAQKITFSHILNNGNVLFATGEKLFLSTDRLKSFSPITVKARDGSDYRPHAPKNPENPGWYFHTLPGVISWDIRGREVMVWGNYCNVRGGATPVNIYYSTDGGRTVKIAYAFGQNPKFRDNGSPGGGGDGTLLGDPANAVICRHVHTVAYNPDEDAFYACTGDLDRGFGHECHWLKGTYEEASDKWKWAVIVSAASNSRYKSGGISFANGKLYWISDANGPGEHDRGVFRCDPADIARPEKHERLFNPGVESGCMIVEGDVIMAAHCAPASPLNTGLILSTDAGKTWAQFDLKEFGKRSPVRFHPPNADGWFRVDLRSGWIDKAEVLFLKMKT